MAIDMTAHLHVGSPCMPESLYHVLLAGSFIFARALRLSPPIYRRSENTGHERFCLVHYIPGRELSKKIFHSGKKDIINSY